MYGERIVLHIVNEIKKGEKGVDEVWNGGGGD
jgi:hypothetical protein